MTPRLLFVVTEIGAARFLEPLWRRWARRPTPFEWKIIAVDLAAEYLANADLARSLPMLAPARQTDVDLAHRLGGWRPTAVLASAGDHYPIEAAAVRLAGDLGVPSAQYIDTWYNYKRRFEHASGPLYPDRILVIDEVARGEAIAECLPSDKLVVVGQPAWELAPQLGDAPEDHVLFLGAPVRRDYGMDLGFDETTVWQTVLDAAKRRPGRFRKLVYGAHPAQVDLSSADVAPALLVHNSIEALRQSGVVLGIFSSPMIDAYIGGRRVVSVQPNLRSRDLCPLSRHGRIARVGDPESLIAAMDAPIAPSGDFARALAGSTDRLEAWLLSGGGASVLEAVGASLAGHAA